MVQALFLVVLVPVKMQKLFKPKVEKYIKIYTAMLKIHRGLIKFTAGWFVH